MSIFTKTDEYVQAPPRNTFDGSYANNLTLKVGQITPCICKPVLPGDSWKIEAQLGFSLDPMVYPVQTDMQCNLHFFYVRNRALWKGWENFITKTENLEGDSTPPYIMLTPENRHMFDTGEIGDYLGVPTIFYGSKNEVYSTRLSVKVNNSLVQGYAMKFYHSDAQENGILARLFATTSETSLDSLVQDIKNALRYGTVNYDKEIHYSNLLKATNNTTQGSDEYRSRLAIMVLPPNTTSAPFVSSDVLKNLTSFGDSNVYTGANYVVIRGVYDITKQRVVAFTVSKFIDGTWQTLRNLNLYNSDYVITPNSDASVSQYLYFAFDNTAVYENEPYTVGNGSAAYSVRYDASNGISNSARQLYDLPFVSTVVGGAGQSGDLRISAMPFRAVEACYNAFYRDDRNNPLMIDGKPYYNIWVQNRNGGADTGIYKMYRKNWLQDVFTTAVQSPQQGIVPIVGSTASGYMTFADEDGKTYFMQAKFGDDGHTITGIESYSSDMPQGTLRAMVDTISTGISINDFRNVNALQRWLETNMRKGLRYKDQIEAHFATSPTYSELQMPEFIGGMSRTVKMSAIEQTVDTLNPDTGTGSPLGTLGGRGSILGNDGKPVTHYFDEHGWIIGFISVTPVPVYSQQLNKELLKTELMDYYFPEFAHLGFQPILNRELAPLQCKSGQQPDGTGLNDVFGYQRAWYEYLEHQDEVHGDFRTYRKDYLIHRIFNGVPKLGADFLTVSPREANEVFAIQTVDGKEIDHIFGQIFFDIKMKRPFPKLGIPKLEVS